MKNKLSTIVVLFAVLTPTVVKAEQVVLCRPKNSFLVDKLLSVVYWGSKPCVGKHTSVKGRLNLNELGVLRDKDGNRYVPNTLNPSQATKYRPMTNELGKTK
jgi:hypothetical protein